MGSDYARALQTLREVAGESRPVQQAAGLQTGFPELDSHLWGGGVPRGVLSLFVSPPGLGATSVWLEIFRRLSGKNRAALWISQTSELYAPALLHRGLDLESLYVVKPPTRSDLQFVLREALEAQTFSWVGCEIASLRTMLRMLPQLKSLVRKTKCGFAFLSPDPLDLQRTHEFGFVAEFSADRIRIPKSKNRPPFAINWRGSYAHLLPELASSFPPANDRGLLDLHPSTVGASERGPAVRGGGTDALALSELKAPA